MKIKYDVINKNDWDVSPQKPGWGCWSKCITCWSCVASWWQPVTLQASLLFILMRMETAGNTTLSLLFTQLADWAAANSCMFTLCRINTHSNLTWKWTSASLSPRSSASWAFVALSVNNRWVVCRCPGARGHTLVHKLKAQEAEHVNNSLFVSTELCV